MLISPEMADVIATAPGCYVAAVGEGLVPQCGRVVGVEQEDAQTLRLVVGTESSANVLDCLAHSRQASFVGAKLATLLTFQFKGEIIEQGEATESDVALVHEYAKVFGALVAHVGLDSERFCTWMSETRFTFLRLRVNEVFDQTPRVGAGNRVAQREQA
jgi:hypothetical protein